MSSQNLQSKKRHHHCKLYDEEKDKTHIDLLCDLPFPNHFFHWKWFYSKILTQKGQTKNSKNGIKGYIISKLNCTPGKNIKIAKNEFTLKSKNPWQVNTKDFHFSESTFDFQTKSSTWHESMLLFVPMFLKFNFIKDTHKSRIYR